MPIAAWRRRWLRAFLLLLLVSVSALTTPDRVRGATATDDEPAQPGYSILLGRFFPLELPSDPQAGFAVEDAAAVPLWSSYVQQGGFPTLGGPTSRRYARDGWSLQHFERGVLRWRPEGEAEVLPLDQVGNAPPEAVVLQSAARVDAEAERSPWSGWWWPATTAVRPPYLFSTNGPLARYDRLVLERSGIDPGTVTWERDQIFFGSGGPRWAGHCNGWAAAALLETEPTQAVRAGSQVFTVDDQKGLLSSYHFADSAAWLYGNPEIGLDALAFHRQLASWLIDQRLGMVIVFNPGGEIWSYPAYRVKLDYASDRARDGLTHVSARVWMADSSVPPDFVGLRPYPDDQGRLFEYTLEGDRDYPTAAAWAGVSLEGGFHQPLQIWYPEPAVRNVGRQLASPNLEYAVIREILASPPADVVPEGAGEATPSPPPDSQESAAGDH